MVLAKENMIEKVCPICHGKFQSRRSTQKYCSRNCTDLAFGWAQKAKRSKSSGERCRIRITAEVPVFAECRPVKGRIYEAERSLPEYTGAHSWWIVEIGGKKIVVRDGEAVEV